MQMLKALRSANPDLTYVCDPVLGDHGKLYVPKELVECYRDKVVPLATVLTPNQFECELLTGVRILSRDDAVRASEILHEKGVSTVVITSIEYEKDGSSTQAEDVVAEVGRREPRPQRVANADSLREPSQGKRRAGRAIRAQPD